MYRPFVTRPAVEVAVNHLLAVGDTDLYPPAIELKYLADHLDQVVPIIAEIEQLAISGTALSHSGIARDVFYTGDLRPRIATQIPVLLAVFSTVHAFSLVNRFGFLLGDTLNDSVFSYRTNLSRPEELFDRDIGWKDFVRKQEELAEDSQWKVSIDLAQFYASVKNHHIDKAATHLSLDIEDKLYMEFFFESVQGSLHGLPVGGDYSRIIGELILLKIDKFALEQGWQYCRFVDDMRLFFSSGEEARSASYHLINFILKLGFQINPAKSRLEQELELPSRMSGRTLEKLGPDGHKSLEYFFDPYSELVITRVEELKQVSSAKNLKQLIETETEKIVPDIRNLKIFISALHYSPHSEVETCYQLLLKQAMNHHYFPILPKLVRLTSAMKPAMDPRLVKILANQLTRDLIESYRKIPDSVLGQICRIISELSGALDSSSCDFFLRLLKDHSSSVFVRREIINLSRLRPEVTNLEVLRTIENEPWLMGAWDPSSLLK